MALDSKEQGTALADEIYDLEQRLAAARLRQRQSQSRISNGSVPQSDALQSESTTKDDIITNLGNPNSILHTLLLLSDSALPLGSFAFSSGLESSLAHQKAKPNSNSPVPNPALNLKPPPTPKSRFDSFLLLSVQSLASTALPYVLAAWREPSRLAELDDDFDASTPCAVARRASVAQGRGLLGVWERSYRGQVEVSSELHGDTDGDGDGGGSQGREARRALATMSSSLKAPHDPSDPQGPNPFPPSGHLPPLWGTVTQAMGLDLRTAAYLFLFSHCRTIVSAGVRASVLGPYQAQMELANPRLGQHIEALMRWNWDVGVEGAAQSVPVVDLWMGRHELLYSRIFNS